VGVVERFEAADKDGVVEACGLGVGHRVLPESPKSVGTFPSVGSVEFIVKRAEAARKRVWLSHHSDGGYCQA
jgi:hypothetical protein